MHLQFFLKYVLFRVGNQSIVYTGDYNMTPDRHLGAAWIDKCRPDILITGLNSSAFNVCLMIIKCLLIVFVY